MSDGGQWKVKGNWLGRVRSTGLMKGAGRNDELVVVGLQRWVRDAGLFNDSGLNNGVNDGLVNSGLGNLGLNNGR